MVTDIASWIVLVVAALTAFGVAFKWLRGGFRKVEKADRLIDQTDAILDLLKRELNHNHGSSLKDDVHGIAVSVHRAHNRIDDVHGEIDALKDLFRTFADANRLVLPVIADAINASPPEERTTL